MFFSKNVPKKAINMDTVEILKFYIMAPTALVPIMDDFDSNNPIIIEGNWLFT